jgi:hypothetical protein
MTPLTTVTILATTLAAPNIAERGRQKDWTVELTFGISHVRDEYRLEDEPADTRQFDIENTPILISVIRANSTFTDHHNDATTGELLLNDRRTNAKAGFDTIKGYGAGAAKFIVDDFEGYEITCKLNQNKSCFATTVRRDLAEAVKWPESWPQGISDALQPQPFIESDDEMIQKLVQTWTNGRVKTVPPYLAAKAITGQVVEYARTTSDLTHNDRNGRFDGINVSGASAMAQNKRGTEADLVCLHVAALRAAGIPARLVIGVDASDKDLIVWTEFYLYDSEAGSGCWLPVDIVELQKSSSRVPRIDRPWRFFAEVKDFHEYIPLAYEFYPSSAPPATNVPAGWTWIPRGRGVPAGYVTWKIYATPNRGGGR